jgi:26 proteasome complex subunit DSS1
MSRLNVSSKNTLNDDTKEKTKIQIFEEDDYFEDFVEEDWDEKAIKEDINFKQWQENWEDEEVDDKFENQIRMEIQNFKKTK